MSASEGRDHPRSRGVYRRRLARLRARRGSSPLARGLRAAEDLPRFELGIIPARAGFTAPLLRLSGLVPDHPRSRGVYPHPTDIYVLGLGSSPLARGLPQDSPRECSATGIIPARAGFTAKTRGRSTGRADHPRSRGVYRVARAVLGGVQGSSPLARGLRWCVVCGVCTCGIIPARAGFTRDVGLRSHEHRGSSPLARGLLFPMHVWSWPPRIIPARAGFTLQFRRSIWTLSDHPRSRGVYASHGGL